MRVVDRKTFLALPPGTAYCKGAKWHFGGLCFKHENAGTNDWYEFDPAWVDGNDSAECFDRLEEMAEKGVSYPMQDSISRDGLFDADALFLIFERDDLTRLRAMIDDALAATS